MTIFIISIIIYLLSITLLSTRALHMLQQNRYNRGYRYIKWIIKNIKETLLNHKLLFLVFIFTNLTTNLNKISSFIFIILLLFIDYIFVTNRKKQKDKLPLKYTRGSYAILAARVMNLTYANYCRMCRDLYGAEIIGKNSYYPKVLLEILA